MQQLNNNIKNHMATADRPFHSWYQFVLGYPPHFVRHCISELKITRDNIVLDPFCGTGTTNVECKRLGVDSFGLEANPMAKFAACTKTNWEISGDEVEVAARDVASAALRSFSKFGLAEENPLFHMPVKDIGIHIRPLDKEPRLTPEQEKVLPRDFISKRPLRKALILKEHITNLPMEEDIKNVLFLVLANVVVNDASNLAFGPEVYTARKREDACLTGSFLTKAVGFALDLNIKPCSYGSALIKIGDARCMTRYFSQKDGIDRVITSPPYPNEKDYTRITRLESIVLGFIKDKKDLRSIKADLLRSNSRNIFVTDSDDKFVKDIRSINELADKIENKRISLGKTSGFEKLYHKIVRLYFGGMFRHFSTLKEILKPGARLAYVVGDQMSFFRINVATAKLLGEIAEQLNYKVEKIELWRSRFATVTKKTLDENILVLRNSG